MSYKRELYKIIFESDTKPGKQFDIGLMWLILLSILIAVLESVPDINKSIGAELYIAEWILTILFSVEYLLRFYCAPKPIRYVFSFWGIIDFLSILPTYLSLFAIGYHYLLVIRIFRLLRVFRILKMIRFNTEAIMLLRALKASYYKISIFLAAILTIVVLLGTVMYVVEGGENGFTSIPQSIYWAIITITTVGYGDIVPQTILGKFISSVAMIIGYSIIAVPTGIVTAEMSKSHHSAPPCPSCDKRNEPNAKFCSKCGTKLTDDHSLD